MSSTCGARPIAPSNRSMANSRAHLRVSSSNWKYTNRQYNFQIDILDATHAQTQYRWKQDDCIRENNPAAPSPQKPFYFWHPPNSPSPTRTSLWFLETSAWTSSLPSMKLPIQIYWNLSILDCLVGGASYPGSLGPSPQSKRPQGRDGSWSW